MIIFFINCIHLSSRYSILLNKSIAKQTEHYTAEYIVKSISCINMHYLNNV